MSKIWKAALLGVILCNNPLAADAQDDFRVKQENNEVILEYDLKKSAQQIDMYVSFDAGRTYNGPLTSVSGDVYDVYKGKNKQIRWNVLADFPEGLQGDVRFKLVKIRRRNYTNDFVTLNIGYLSTLGGTAGITVGHYFNQSKWGIYFRGETGIFSGYYEGADIKENFGLGIGTLYRLTPNFALKFGVGYSSYNMYYYEFDGRNEEYEYDDDKPAGTIDLGAHFYWNSFVFSLDLTPTYWAETEDFYYEGARIGVGFRF